MTTRRGTTLVELLIVMTGCAAFLSLSGQLLHRALKTQSESRRFFDAERTAWRLAEDFRRDVHAADAATTDGAGGAESLLRLELPEHRVVVYTREGASIVRTLTRPDGPAARELYPLPARSAIEVEVDDAGRLVTLLIEAEEADPEAPPPTRINEARIHVEAVAQLGRDGRFDAADAGEEVTP